MILHLLPRALFYSIFIGDKFCISAQFDAIYIAYHICAKKKIS